MAIIRPVTKVGTPCSPCDLRPISIVFVLLRCLNAFSLIKGAEACQWLQYVVRFSVWFHRWHSTATALVRVIEDLRSAKAEEKVWYMFFYMGCLFISSIHGMTFIRQLWAWFHRFFGIVLWSLRLMV
jgi:hypothetical protein